MKRYKFLFFPPYITNILDDGQITSQQLMDESKWSDILSRSTVTKVKQLNSFTGGGDSQNETVMKLLGLQWAKSYVEPTVEIPSNFKVLQTLMSDGRESETDLIFDQLHNFQPSFKWERAANGTYLILLNELKPLNDIAKRYVELRMNMGELIDDMSSLVNHDDFVCEPIVQSYMINSI